MERGSYQMSVVNLVQNQGNGILEGSIGFPRLFVNDIESFGDIDGDNRQAFYFWRVCSDFLLAVMSVSGFKSIKAIESISKCCNKSHIENVQVVSDFANDVDGFVCNGLVVRKVIQTSFGFGKSCNLFASNNSTRIRGLC